MKYEFYFREGYWPIYFKTEDLTLWDVMDEMDTFIIACKDSREEVFNFYREALIFLAQ